MRIIALRRPPSFREDERNGPWPHAFRAANENTLREGATGQFVSPGEESAGPRPGQGAILAWSETIDMAHERTTEFRSLGETWAT